MGLSFYKTMPHVRDIVIMPHVVWFGLVFLFNGISTFSRLFNAKAILLEE